MGFKKGQKVKLKNVGSYESSDQKKPNKKRTGTYYIWSAATRNGRIRITEKKSYVGKEPASKYVLCWVKVASISSGTSKKQNKKEPAETKKTTTTKKKEDPNKPSSKKNTTTVINIAEPSDVTPSGLKQNQIGYLGMVIFEVSESVIRTLSNFRWTASANYEEHQRHLKRPTLEFTGINSETITFDMELSRYTLGVTDSEGNTSLAETPLKSWNKLKDYMEHGTAVPLRIGNKSYGRYRWCIKNLEFLGGNTNNIGHWLTCKISVTLMSTEKKG